MKKFLSMIALLLVLAAGLFLFASCKKDAATPTEAPTEDSTQAPTEAPTDAPTDAPTETPTETPTEPTCAHEYDNDCDKECNLCHEIRDVGAHVEAVVDAVDATCTTSGLTEGSVCSVCGEVLKAQEEVPALGHTEETIPEVAATCHSNGSTEGKKCSVCGEVTVAPEIIPATGAVIETIDAVDATCTTSGLTAGAKCKECGLIIVEQVEVPAYGHTVVTVMGTPASCETTGLTAGKKCVICSEMIEAQQEIPATGHNWKISEGYAPTCTQVGITDGKMCTNCGRVDSKVEIIPALGHNLTAYGENKDATCTEAGSVAGQKCERCGYIKTDIKVIPATGHTEAAIGEYIAPTCTEAGLTAGVKCSVCDAVIEEQAAIDALGHTEEVIPALDPTCTEAGLTEGAKCSVCGEILVEQTTIDALGHTEETIPALDPTCTEAGLTEGAKCSVCGEILVEQTAVDALGHAWSASYANTDSSHWQTCTNGCGEKNNVGEHNYGEDSNCTVCGYACKHKGGMATCTQQAVCIICANPYGELRAHTIITHGEKAPTCTSTGWNAYETCYNCDYSTYIGIPALGHEWNTDYVNTNPYSHWQACNNGCGEKINVSEHIYEEGSPICSVCGYGCSHTGGKATCAQQAVCEKCGNAYGELLPHVIVNYDAKDPTCTSIGWKAYEACSNCNYTTYKEIPALGHDWNEEYVNDSSSHWQACNNGCGEKKNAGNHTYDDNSNCTVCGYACQHTGGKATCTEKAVCVACGQPYGELLPHTILNHSAKAPTCTSIGWEAYETCIKCNYTTYEELPALGHNPQTVSAVDPTCTKAGLTEGEKCSVCNTVLKAQQTIPATGHTEVIDEAKAPTCTETGISEGIHCSVCNAVIKAQTTIPATGHKNVTVASKAPTCTETGLTEGVSCSVCDAVIVQQDTLAALGHAWNDSYVNTDASAHWQTCKRCDAKNNVSAHTFNGTETCTVCGHICIHTGGNATCSDKAICVNCGTPYGELLEHTKTYHEAKAPTCTEYGWEAYEDCSVCDYTTYKVIPALGHKMLLTIPAVPATCTQDGQKVAYQCNVCKLLYADEACKNQIDKPTVIPATGHTEVTIPASPANPPCSGKGLSEGVQCSVCLEWIVARTETAPAAHTIITIPAIPATCTSAGMTAGEACSVCGEIFIAQAEDPMTGHTYSADCDAYCDVCLAVRAKSVACKDTDSDGICDVCTTPIPASTVMITGKPSAGTAYKFYLAQNNTSKILYLDGGVSGKYLTTTEDIGEAVDVYAISASGGFKFYTVNNKAEINYIYYDGSYLAYSTENATVFTFDETLRIWTTTYNGTKYYIGTYNSFNTVSASKTSYIDDENRGVSQFPAELAILTACIDHVYTADCDTTCNLCGAERATAVAHVYDNCEDTDCNNCGATRDAGTCVDTNSDGKCDVCGAKYYTKANIDFTKQGYSNQQVITSVDIGNIATATFDKGSNSNTPKYFTSGTAVRVYGGSTVTVTAKPGYNITRIEIGGHSGNALSADCGTLTDATWTGNSSTVTFTVSGTSGNARIQSITVYYEYLYFVIGEGAGDLKPVNWDLATAAEKLAMKKTAVENEYVIDSIKLYAGDQFKITCGTTWDNLIGDFYNLDNTAGAFSDNGGNIQLCDGKDGIYKITFTINPENSSQNKITYELIQPIEPLQVENKYYLVGSFADANFKVKDGVTPVLTGEGDVLTCTFTAPNDDFNFKVVYGSELSITNWYGDWDNSNGNFVVSAGTYTVAINTKSGRVVCVADGETMIDISKVYLVGSFNSWKPGTDAMTESEDGSTWSITYTLAENDEFKVYNAINNGWYGDGGNNFKCTEAGKYVITYTVSTNTVTVNKISTSDPNPGEGSISNATLSFASKDQRTEFDTKTQQVWEQKGIKFTNAKSSSTNAIADYAAPVRCYANSTITLEAKGMTTVVFNCNSNSYATALGKSTVDGATITVSGKVVTITFATAVDTFTTSLTAQVRIDSIVVNPS